VDFVSQTQEKYIKFKLKKEKEKKEVGRNLQMPNLLISRD
jgi:hypothetical protein